MPPCDIMWAYEREYPSGSFRRRRGAGAAAEGDAGSWEVVPDMNDDGSPVKVPWVSIDVSGTPGHCGSHCPLPLSRHITRLEVTVKRGEVLFLPALWYHQVAHVGGSADVSIAVNWWLNMRFDGPLWAMYSLCRGLATLVQQEEEKAKVGDLTRTAGAAKALTNR